MQLCCACELLMCSAECSGGTARRAPIAAAGAAKDADERHPTIARLLGEGPWAIGDAPISGGQGPVAFLRGGVLSTPWGGGSHAALSGGAHGDVEMMINGGKHTLTVEGVIGCYQARPRTQPPLARPAFRAAVR